jgi:hypothetical protein
VQHAYRRLNERHGEEGPPAERTADAVPPPPDASSTHSTEEGPFLQLRSKMDLELREHRALIEEWFVRDSADLEGGKAALELVLEALALEVRDMGARNTNEEGQTMYNQCFYLSLARAFLRDDGAGGEPEKELIGETALHFKRVVRADATARVPPGKAPGASRHHHRRHLSTLHPPPLPPPPLSVHRWRPPSCAPIPNGPRPLSAKICKPSPIFCSLSSREVTPCFQSSRLPSSTPPPEASRSTEVLTTPIRPTRPPPCQTAARPRASRR